MESTLCGNFTPSFCSAGNSGESTARRISEMPSQVLCCLLCLLRLGSRGLPGAPIWKHLFSPRIFLIPPWIMVVQLEPARCPLAASPCPLPTQPSCHSQSLQSYASCQIQSSCPGLAWPLDTAAQSWVELIPWGVDVLDSKINSSVALLNPLPWRVLQTTSLALTACPCRQCPQFLLSPSHEKVAVLPTGSPLGGVIFL